ncbi:hypothetical protein [Asaia sp. HumB]|uniref:hypothetical protein n=1 Tax=Asaia sp. HumB TaxID=3035475 RepID=UPI002554336A|nr:hypothetical protein [Asaia sp. HumB]MDL2169597.1 hypothetical protein [Asaia sp. HumB]
MGRLLIYIESNRQPGFTDLTQSQCPGLISLDANHRDRLAKVSHDKHIHASSGLSDN